MNLYLHKFVKDKFSEPGSALDLGAGNFFDVAGLEKLGWKCKGVDLNTGDKKIDLETPYLSKNKHDLVYCNYVLHKLNNKEQLIKTASNKLKAGGWFFLHVFDESDTNSNTKLNEKKIRILLNNFKNVSVKIFDFYDNEHQHWHRIIEASGKKA